MDGRPIQRVGPGENGGRNCRHLPTSRVAKGSLVELRTVLLENQDAPVWEVYVREQGVGTRLVPGQHCARRTMPAEQWLHEIQTQVLPDLASRAERARVERLAQQDAQHARNPADQPELLHVAALAVARKEVLGSDYARVCRAAEAAAHRCAKAAAALRRHQLVGDRPPVFGHASWGWVVRWRKHRRLRQHLAKAQAWQERTQAQRQRLERATDAPDTIARIEQRARELLKTDQSSRRQLAVLEQEERHVSQMLAEAQTLVPYLQLRQGSPVALEHTAVRGRAHWPPTIPVEPQLRPNPPAQTVLRPPSLASTPLGANGTVRSNHKPEPLVTASATQRTGTSQPAPARQARSNGVRMKM